jgi:hypothetical protein
MNICPGFPGTSLEIRLMFQNNFLADFIPYEWRLDWTEISIKCGDIFYENTAPPQQQPLNSQSKYAFSINIIKCIILALTPRNILCHIPCIDVYKIKTYDCKVCIILVTISNLSLCPKTSKKGSVYVMGQSRKSHLVCPVLCYIIFAPFGCAVFTVFESQTVRFLEKRIFHEKCDFILSTNLTRNFSPSKSRSARYYYKLFRLSRKRVWHSAHIFIKTGIYQ